MWENSKIEVADDDASGSRWRKGWDTFKSAAAQDAVKRASELRAGNDAAYVARVRAEVQKAKADEEYLHQAQLDALPERLRRAEANISAAEAEWDYAHPEQAAERDAKALERKRLQIHKANVEAEAARDQDSPEIRLRRRRQSDWETYVADKWESFYVAEANARTNRKPKPDEPNLPTLVPSWFSTGHPTTRTYAAMPLTPLTADDRNSNGHKVLEPRYQITYVDQSGPTPEEQIAANAAKDRKHG